MPSFLVILMPLSTKELLHVPRTMSSTLLDAKPEARKNADGSPRFQAVGSDHQDTNLDHGEKGNWGHLILQATAPSGLCSRRPKGRPGWAAAAVPRTLALPPSPQRCWSALHAEVRPSTRKAAAGPSPHKLPPIFFLLPHLSSKHGDRKASVPAAALWADG